MSHPAHPAQPYDYTGPCVVDPIEPVHMTYVPFEPAREPQPKPDGTKRDPVKVCVFRFPYGGSEHPDVTDWLIETSGKMNTDVRISDTHFCRLADTPITMCRNMAIEQAKRLGVDLLVMVDNDVKPDLGQGKYKIPGSLKFWDSSFDYWWNHQDEGPIIIGAPYCGPPPHCNVYVFLWRQLQDHPAESEFCLKQYEREEVVELRGIQPVAALPTGLILIDMRVFQSKSDGSYKALEPPFFYYEYPDERTLEKLSTEDVTFTRDASLNGAQVLCNWDAWCGHWKRYLVGKPRPMHIDEVPQKFREVVQRMSRQTEVPGNEIHRGV